VKSTWIMVITLLVAGCATHQASPARYALGIERGPFHVDVPLNTPLEVRTIQAPSWLRSTAITYRLLYVHASQLRTYGQSRWIAPANELLTLRLREGISAAGRRPILDRALDDADRYRLDVSLRDFRQEFPSPTQSRCLVVFNATLTYDHRVIAQRDFVAEQPAPTADADGAALGLGRASDEAIGQLVRWLGTILPS
jgi:cholesterol transport system auxiliary component